MRNASYRENEYDDGFVSKLESGHEYFQLVKQADDYAEQERRKRLSRSQPLRINWMPVLGVTMLLLALGLAFGAGLWVRTWFQ